MVPKDGTRSEEKWDEEYGPMTEAVHGVFVTLSSTRWFSKIGKPLRNDNSIVQVHSWDEALQPFKSGDPAYDASGHLAASARKCHLVMKTEPYQQWYEKAVADAGDYCNYGPYIPESLDPSWADWLDNYLYQFTANLLAEIIGSEMVNSTYFRDMSSWSHKGRFPCGWSGKWPDGKMRVF